MTPMRLEGHEGVRPNLKINVNDRRVRWRELCEECENDVTESFARGLDKLTEGKARRYSEKSREAKNLVRGGLLEV